MIKPFKGRRVQVGEEVFAYRNLHRDEWSVQVDGLIVGHADELVIENPKFVVREGGRQRVIREGRKNVHAGIRGILSDGRLEAPEGRVSYNPYRAGHFYRVDSQEPIHEAHSVLLDANGKAWAA